MSRRNPERGVALLLALFGLLLLTVIALSLIASAGTESSLAANYRTSTQAYYAALSGMEEGRGRLWPKGPNPFSSSFMAPMGGTVLAVGQVRYILNPGPGEAVSPTNLVTSNPYADFEYQQEFGTPVSGAAVQIITSVSPQAGLPAQLYKWVRITPITEQSIGYDVNGDGTLDKTTALYYDGSKLNLTSTGKQALEITSLAVLAGGSQKIVQYVAAPVPYLPSFSAALTFDGTNDSFSAPNSNVYWVNGNDQASGGTCQPVQPSLPAIGVPDNTDVTNVSGAIPSNRKSHYTGTGGTPSVSNVSGTIAAAFQSVNALDGPAGLLQTIQGLADYNVTGPASSLPAYGSAAAPVTAFVSGNLTLSGNVTGYGILVVTGTFSGSGNVGWKGVVLVVGQGIVSMNGGGNNEYDGAILVAKTRDTLGNLLPTLGSASVSWSGGGGNGVFYNSCAINTAQQNAPYSVLSFREIPQ